MFQSRKFAIAIIVMVVFTLNLFIFHDNKADKFPEDSYSSSSIVTETSNSSLLNILKQNNSKVVVTEETYPHNFELTEKPRINEHNFEYILNPGSSLCGLNKGQDLLLIAFVPISACNFIGRNTIRQTWANFNQLSNLKVIFILGSMKNSTLSDEINFESEIYGDIVQEDFVDSYKNLTLKTLAGLKWVSTYCSNARFTLKIDDDVVVNPIMLLDFLAELNSTHFHDLNLKNSFFCKKISTALAERNKSSKFFLSREAYAPDYFPAYCDGPAYVFSTDMTSSFYELSKNVSAFIYEDVYMGMLATKLNSTFVDLNDKYARGYRLAKPEGIGKYEKKMFVYANSLNEFSFLWNHFLLRIRNFYDGLTTNNE